MTTQTNSPTLVERLTVLRDHIRNLDSGSGEAALLTEAIAALTPPTDQEVADLARWLATFKGHSHIEDRIVLADESTERVWEFYVPAGKKLIETGILHRVQAMPSLFQSGVFKLHSGHETTWKIDCDALTDSDWETLAKLAVAKLEPFRSVVGVPTGGLKFAKALEKYASADARIELICDDVLTTGTSMEDVRAGSAYYRGVVAFARGECPDWVTPLFSFGRVQAMPTREQIAQLICKEICEFRLDPYDPSKPASPFDYKLADAILALFREGK